VGQSDASAYPQRAFPPEIVGAKSNDCVEIHLKIEVCSRRMTLRNAQDIIWTDWFKYYRDEKLK
jgi:hypothetical protein